MLAHRFCIVLAALLPTGALRCRQADPGRLPPSEYDSWTAAEKVAWWKSNLDVGSGGSKDVATWWEDPDSSLCMKEECIYPGGKKTRSDVVPSLSCRQTGIHADGMVAFVRAVWEDTPYTGMFKGADLGFARWGFQIRTEKITNMSIYAEEYASGTYKPEPVPGRLDECDVKDCMNVTKPWRYSEWELEEGERPDSPQFMALKFFRDGVPSAAIHTGSLSYPTANFMSRTYSNLMQFMPGDTFNNTELGSMSDQAAQRGTLWPSFTGLHDMAMYDQAGTLQHDINFPWQLLFFPAEGTAGKIPENVVGFWPQMLREHRALTPGTTLFDIYAKHSLEAGLVRIGRLELASELMLSADTDRQVFFYHPRYERDLVLRPELTEGYNCRDQRVCLLCPVFLEFCEPSNEVLEGWRLIQEDALANLTAKSAAVYRRLNLTTEKVKRLAQLPAGCTGGAALKAGRRPTAKAGQSAPAAGMRADDWTVEPLTGLLHNPDWFCAADGSWPTVPRGLAEGCNSTLVPGRLRTEPEYAVDPSCQSLPACSKTDGTWYSSSYPCLCGTSTCSTGQLCMSRTSTCTTWGPYARAAATGQV